MNELIEIFLETPKLYITSIVLFLTSCITTFDMRLIQQEKKNIPGEIVPQLPQWVAAFIWIDWGLIIALFVMSWKHAIAIVAIRFILKVIPSLEIVGSLIMSPFLSKKLEL